MKETNYPGYKNTCNGCGLCCLTAPCAVSDQLGLWKKGRCVALQKLPNKYICKVISNPRSVSVWLSKQPLKNRLDAIGSVGICDHRAASTQEEVERLLTERNAVDEYLNSPEDTYPRGVVLHHGDKKLFCTQNEKEGPINIEEIN